MRTLFLTVALAVSVPALACGDDANCPMKHAGVEAVDFDTVDKADGTKLAFAISGLKCGKCAARVIQAVGALEGVNAIAVDSDVGRAKIAFDAAKIDEKAIRKAITDLGYTPGEKEA